MQNSYIKEAFKKSKEKLSKIENKTLNGLYIPIKTTHQVLLFVAKTPGFIKWVKRFKNDILLDALLNDNIIQGLLDPRKANQGLNIPNENGLDAFIMSIKNGDDLVKKFIVENQSNFKNECIDINTKDSFGDDAMIYATKSGKIDNCRYVTEFAKIINENILKSHFDGSNSTLLDTNGREILFDFISLRYKEINFNNTNKHGKTALMYAAMSDNPKIFSFLAVKALKNKTEKTDFSLTDNKGRNILHYASIYGNTDVVECINTLGIQIDSTKKDIIGKTPMDYAKERQDKEYDKFLQDYNNNIAESEMLYAVYPLRNNKFITVLEELIKSKSEKFNSDEMLLNLDEFERLNEQKNWEDKDTRYSILDYIKKLAIEGVKYLGYQNKEAIYKMAENFHECSRVVSKCVRTYEERDKIFFRSFGQNIFVNDFYRFLIDLDAARDENGKTALMIAIELRDTKKLNWVIENCTIETSELDLKKRDNDGNTALMLAVDNNYRYAIREIMNYKINAVKDCVESYSNILELNDSLINNVDKTIQEELNKVLNIQNNQGKTAIIKAVEQFNYRALRMILKYCTKIGLEPNFELKDNNGYSAIAYAYEQNNSHAVEMILKFKANNFKRNKYSFARKKSHTKSFMM